MKFVFLLLTSICSTFSFAQPNTWEQVSDFGGISRLHSVSFTVGNFAFVGLGSDGNNLLQDFWKYDPSTNAWTPIADFIGSPRYGSVAFSLNGKGYVGLGIDNSGYKNDFFEYDPVSNLWTQISNFPGTPREAAVAFTLLNKGYVGLGADITSDRNDFYQYNPSSNSWIQIANFAGGNRRFAVSFSVNEFGYVGTGLNGSVLHSDFWKYDSVNNTWIQVSSLPGPARAGASSFALGNFGYIGTGSFPYLQDFWKFDTNQNIWTQGPNFIGSARELGVGFSVNGKGYIGTGFSTINTKDFFKFNPNCNNVDTLLIIESCNSYTIGNDTYSNSGQFTQVLNSSAGCDSLITINLTIHQNTTSSISPTSCSSYVAPDGQIYTQSGTYNATIPNAFGCDSVITINLTIQNVDTGVSVNVNTLTSNSTGSQYKWIDCATNQPVAGATQQSFTPTYNGSFAVIVTNGNCSDTSSCTSVSHVTLDEMTSSTFSVQPNPTNGIVTISGLKSSAQNRVVLYTISGEEMAELVTTESEMELNLEVYAPGMYFLHVQDQVIRIVKN